MILDRLGLSPARILTAGDLRVRLGGEADFRPQVSFTRWRSAGIALELLHDEPGVTSVDQQAIVWTAPSLEARFYSLNLEDGGGFEFAVHFYERPASNELQFRLTTFGGAVLWHQPALAHRRDDGSMWEDNGRGGIRQRPEWAVDTLAVYVPHFHGNYSACGGWNYRSGKVGHLHRMWVRDAVGHQAWCRWTLKGDILTLIIPPDFHASAVYPIVVDPTFGYTTHGASDDNPAQNWIWVKATSNPTAGDLTGVTSYGRNKAGTATLDVALYDDGGTEKARLAAVNSGGTNFGASDAEVTCSISYVGLTAVQYYLGVKNEAYVAGTPDFWNKYDSSGGATELLFLSPGSSQQPVNWPADTTGKSSDNTERWSVNGIFTASGGGLTVDQEVPAFTAGNGSGIIGRYDA